MNNELTNNAKTDIQHISSHARIENLKHGILVTISIRVGMDIPPHPRTLNIAVALDRVLPFIEAKYERRTYTRIRRKRDDSKMDT